MKRSKRENVRRKRLKIENLLRRKGRTIDALVELGCPRRDVIHYVLMKHKYKKIDPQWQSRLDRHGIYYTWINPKREDKKL